VNAIETINEPALYTEATHGPGIRWFANRTIPTIRHLLDEGGREDVEIVLSYTGSDAESFAQFLSANTADWGTQSVSVDFHQYFTWDHGVYSPGSDTVTWAQAATEVSHGQWNQFSQYYSSINHIKSYVGEWTLAINGDQVHLAQADENNLFDGHMKATYQEQASSPSRRKQAILAQKRTITHSLSDNRPAVRAAFIAQKCNWFETGAAGDYYWSARMGSGWDPRSCGQFETNLTVLATPGFGLNKCQVTNSSYDNSLARFRFPLWNFLESAKQLGIDRELMRNFASLCNH
jgi:ubiquitin